MKLLSKLLVTLNIYFILGGTLGLLMYLSGPDDYRFGTEVAGFSYNSAMHHIFTHACIFAFGIVGLLLHKFNIFNKLIRSAICLFGLIVFLML